MKTETKDEIKTCPLCGADGEIESFYNSTMNRFFVRCKNPNCEAFAWDDDATPEKAIARWNKRLFVDLNRKVKIKRCPWCNSKAKLIECNSSYPNGNFLVSCNNENCGFIVNCGSPTEKEALEKWNKRHIDIINEKPSKL